MAKSSRSSVIKANNRRLKTNVFGPTETARTQRLSDKLLELSKQPKPAQAEQDAAMDVVEGIFNCSSLNYWKLIFVDVDERGRSGAKPTESKKDGQSYPFHPLDRINTIAVMDVDETKAAAPKPSKSRIEKKKVKARKPGIVFPRFKDGPKNPKGKRVFRNQ